MTLPDIFLCIAPSVMASHFKCPTGHTVEYFGHQETLDFNRIPRYGQEINSIRDAGKYLQNNSPCGSVIPSSSAKAAVSEKRPKNSVVDDVASFNLRRELPETIDHFQTTTSNRKLPRQAKNDVL